MRVLLSWDSFDRITDELIPSEEVAVETRLNPTVDFPDDRSTLRMELADPESPLRSTTSWVGTDIQQFSPSRDDHRPASTAEGKKKKEKEELTAVSLEIASTTTKQPTETVGSDCCDSLPPEELSSSEDRELPVRSPEGDEISQADDHGPSTPGSHRLTDSPSHTTKSGADAKNNHSNRYETAYSRRSKQRGPGKTEDNR